MRLISSEKLHIAWSESRQEHRLVWFRRAVGWKATKAKRKKAAQQEQKLESWSGEFVEWYQRPDFQGIYTQAHLYTHERTRVMHNRGDITFVVVVWSYSCYWYCVCHWEKKSTFVLNYITSICTSTCTSSPQIVDITSHFDPLYRQHNRMTKILETHCKNYALKTPTRKWVQGWGSATRGLQRVKCCFIETGCHLDNLSKSCKSRRILYFTLQLLFKSKHAFHCNFGSRLNTTESFYSHEHTEI